MNILRKPFRYTFFNATLTLIFINIAVYLFSSMTKLNLNIFSLNILGFGFSHFFWQPVTYMFMHGSFQHLLFNMLGLFFFGLAVERYIGSKEFLLLYFLTGILSGLLTMALYFLTGLREFLAGSFNPVYVYSIIGASGAIFGVLFSYAVLFPRSKIFIWGILPVPAPILVLMYAILELSSSFIGYGKVAHFTHLAGFLVAWLYFIVRVGINPIKVWKDVFKR